MASSPLIIVPTTPSVAAVLVSVKARAGNDGACGQGRATADLDRPCARRPQHVWVGAKKRDSESNKETAMKEVESGVEYTLDFKSPIQGLLSVHSRCGLHTRAVTNSSHANRRLQPLRYLHDCSDCFRLERLPGGACTHWKAPPCHGARQKRSSRSGTAFDKSMALRPDLSVHFTPSRANSLSMLAWIAFAAAMSELPPLLSPFL